MSADRSLPPGDYAYVANGTALLPCAVVGRRGRWFSTVLMFEPYRGTSQKRVRTKRLLGVEETNRLIAFRSDPMALLHAGRADEETLDAATSRATEQRQERNSAS